MKCNNHCNRLLTVSRNSIHSHVDRHMYIHFHMRCLIQSMSVGLIIFCSRWIRDIQALFTVTGSSQEISKYFWLGLSTITSILRLLDVVRSYLKNTVQNHGHDKTEWDLLPWLRQSALGGCLGPGIMPTCTFFPYDADVIGGGGGRCFVLKYVMS